jgi:hypothetical protein
MKLNVQRSVFKIRFVFHTNLHWCMHKIAKINQVRRSSIVRNVLDLMIDLFGVGCTSCARAAMARLDSQPLPTLHGGQINKGQDSRHLGVPGCCLAMPLASIHRPHQQLTAPIASL